jgi:hypothetical protein
MNNVMDFDTDDAEIVDVDFDKPLPAGPYPALIQRVETKPTKDGTGTRVNIQHKVTEGEHKGRVFLRWPERGQQEPASAGNLARAAQKAAARRRHARGERPVAACRV